MNDGNDTPAPDADGKPLEPLSKLLMRLQLSNVRSHYHELAHTAGSVAVRAA